MWTALCQDVSLTAADFWVKYSSLTKENKGPDKPWGREESSNFLSWEGRWSPIPKLPASTEIHLQTETALVPSHVEWTWNVFLNGAACDLSPSNSPEKRKLMRSQTQVTQSSPRDLGKQEDPLSVLVTLALWAVFLRCWLWEQQERKREGGHYWNLVAGLSWPHGSFSVLPDFKVHVVCVNYTPPWPVCGAGCPRERACPWVSWLPSAEKGAQRGLGESWERPARLGWGHQGCYQHPQRLRFTFLGFFKPTSADLSMWRWMPQVTQAYGMVLSLTWEIFLSSLWRIKILLFSFIRENKYEYWNKCIQSWKRSVECPVNSRERTFLSCLNKDNFSPYKMKVINSITQHGNSEHTRQFHLHTLLSTTFEGDEESTK